MQNSVLDDVDERRGPGRPKDLKKRDMILAAARDLFIKRGVESVSIESVAAAAGVSKMTVYASFKDKAVLFENVVLTEAKFMEDRISTDLPKATHLRQSLTLFGNVLLSFLLGPDLSAFDRLFAMETVHHPDLAHRMFNNGPGHMRLLLRDLIVMQADQSGLQINNPLQAAEDLIALWLGMKPVEINYGTASLPDTDEIAKRVEHGIQIFFKAYK